jgi:hypothetical protein
MFDVRLPAMNALPRYYRRPFWLGLFIILFLGGAWLRSSYYWDQAGVASFIMTNRDGEVSFAWNPVLWNRGAYASFDGIRPHRIALPSSSYFYRSDSGTIVVKFAHWFLILLTFLSWLILLAWKRQQLQLLTKMAKDAEAETTGPDHKL